MKTCSLLLLAAASLAYCLPAEARFDSSPFQDVPKASRPTSSSSSTARRPVADDDDEDDDARPAAAQKPKYDRRVKAALDAKSMKYRIKDNGTFTLTMSWEKNGEERSHLIFIRSVTEKMSGFEIREVWAVGQKDCHLKRSELANILALNETYKIGSWSIIRSSEGDETLVFTAHIPADFPAESLVGIAWAVAKTADEHELKYTGKDDL